MAKTEAIDPLVADKILARCARHCCVCRRYMPNHIQVHHIVEKHTGGSNDEENLIAVCVVCHMDVHSKVPFSRRFSANELKMVRDGVYKLVSQGRLPHDESQTNSLLFEMLDRLKREASEPLAPKAFSPELLALLLRASAAPIRRKQVDEDTFIFSGEDVIANTSDPHAFATTEAVLRNMVGKGLLFQHQDIFAITALGLTVVETILAERKGLRGRPFGTGPGIFGAYGDVLRIHPFSSLGPVMATMELKYKSRKLATKALNQLRSQLTDDSAEANMLRNEHSGRNVLRFLGKYLIDTEPTSWAIYPFNMGQR